MLKIISNNLYKFIKLLLKQKINKNIMKIKTNNNKINHNNNIY